MAKQDDTTNLAELPSNSEALIVDNIEVLDRLVSLGRSARGLGSVELTAPDGAGGVPTKVPAIVRYTESGPLVEGVEKYFEAYRTAPKRRTGTAKVTTLQSFIDLFNRHKDDHSVIFAETGWPDPKLAAILDYHEKDGGSPRFGSHRIEYAFPLTAEFKGWINKNGVSMDQGEFAAFIEERVADLAAPLDAEISEYEPLFRTTLALPTHMVDLSRGLQVNVAAKATQAVMLSSGEGEISYQEEHRNSAGEKLTVPGIFMIAVPAFIDGEPVRIPARLRYRLREGAIKWSYQLYKWDFWLREQVKNDLDTAARETKAPAFEGKPEA